MPLPDITSPPSLKRRIASMLYEAMLLFGVIAVAGGLFSTVLDQRHALYLRQPLQYVLFAVVGLYFIWFWMHGGQTLAMKTWRVRLVTSDGGPIKAGRALCRYLLAWSWILPGLALAWALGAKNEMLLLIPAANLLLWALTIYLDPQRQFLHDRIVGTRIIVADPPDAAEAG
jgi:uncharacterized RDD family membrane protein YckC